MAIIAQKKLFGWKEVENLGPGYIVDF